MIHRHIIREDVFCFIADLYLATKKARAHELRSDHVREERSTACCVAAETSHRVKTQRHHRLPKISPDSNLILSGMSARDGSIRTSLLQVGKTGSVL